MGTQVGGDRIRPGQEAKWTGHEDGQAGSGELSKTRPRTLAWWIVGLFLRWGPRGRTNLGGDTEVSLSHMGSEDPKEVYSTLRLETAQKESGWVRR